jgi:hypothetical protein
MADEKDESEEYEQAISGKEIEPDFIIIQREEQD